MKNFAMKIRSFLIILCLGMSSVSSAQTDFYDHLKVDYDRLRKEEKQDSALAIAKQMNAWVLKNESDTSLRYAVSLRYIGNCFNQIETGDSAIYYWDESIKVLKSQNKSESLDAAYCHFNKGSYYENRGNFNLAIFNYNLAVLFCDRTQPSICEDCALFYGALGGIFFENKDFATSEKLIKKSLRIFEFLDSMGSAEYALSLHNMAVLYSEFNDFENSVKYFKKSLEMYKDVIGIYHIDYFMCLNNLAQLYFIKGDYRSAEFYFKMELETCVHIFGKESDNYANCLNNLGRICTELNDFISAKAYFKELVGICPRTSSSSSNEYAISLYNLGAACYYLKEYKLSVEFLVQSLQLLKNLNGGMNEIYLNKTIMLGEIFLELNDNKSALFYFEQALEISERIYVSENRVVLVILSRIANLYSSMMYYEPALDYSQRANEIASRLLERDSEDYLMNIVNLAGAYLNSEQFKSAELYYIQALELAKSIFSATSEIHATVSNNLGIVYYRIGNYSKALNFYMSANELFKLNGGEYDSKYIMSLKNIGAVYLELGNKELAIKYFFEFKEKSLNGTVKDSLSYLDGLITMGNLYGLINDSETQENLYKHAEFLCLRNPFFSERLFIINYNLGKLYIEKYDFISAEYYLKKAEETYLKFLDQSKSGYTTVLNMLGDLYTNKGEFVISKTYYKKSLEVESDNLFINFSWLSAKEKFELWQKERDFYLRLNYFSVLSQDSCTTELAYNSNLISKSLILESSLELDEAISQSSDNTLKSQFTEMKQLRRAYNKMQSEGSGKREIMDRYNLQADSLDKILVNKLGEYAASKRKFEITWKDVQSNLSANEAAIEFARYYDDKDSTDKYLALVVRPGYAYPELVKLGKEEDIRAANQSKAHDFAALYDYVWKDIDSLLVGVNTVYYSPAGELNNVSFSALCFGTGDSLIASTHTSKRGVEIELESAAKRSCNGVLLDKYVLHQLTTTRYLADGTLKKNRELNSSITLMGGINYDDVPAANKNTVHEESEEDYALNLNLTNQFQDKRGNRSSSGVGRPMKYLEGTRAEVTHITAQLNGSWSVQTMSNRNASEHSLKGQLETKSPGVLHIATHGFAFPDVKQEESSQLMIDEKPAYKISEDPMVRCGLMLSGSNISWTGNPKKMIEQTGEDGILTAAEVSSMNLSNTKLVVLSACETGLGKIEGSEGTFGLKRGFKLAGVEQMIVSLWSVPDKETMELMTLFYTDLTKTLNPVVSFEKAQKEMRIKYPTEPEKWAGFVLVR